MAAGARGACNAAFQRSPRFARDDGMEKSNAFFVCEDEMDGRSMVVV